MKKRTQPLHEKQKVFDIRAKRWRGTIVKVGEQVSEVKWSHMDKAEFVSNDYLRDLCELEE